MRKTWALVSFVPAPERERLKRQMSADGAGLKSAVRENEAWSPGATDTRSDTWVFPPAGAQPHVSEGIDAACESGPDRGFACGSRGGGGKGGGPAGGGGGTAR